MALGGGMRCIFFWEGGKEAGGCDVGDRRPLRGPDGRVVCGGPPLECTCAVGVSANKTAMSVSAAAHHVMSSRRLKMSRPQHCVRGGRVRGRCVPPLPPSVAPSRGCAWRVAEQIKKSHRLSSWQRQSRRQSPMLAPPKQSFLGRLPVAPTLCRGALSTVCPRECETPQRG